MTNSSIPNIKRIRDISCHADPVRIPVEFGNCAVISDDVQVDWGDEAIIEEFGQIYPDIEWVLASQANEVGVAFDPDVRVFASSGWTYESSGRTHNVREEKAAVYD